MLALVRHRTAKQQAGTRSGGDELPALDPNLPQNIIHSSIEEDAAPYWDPPALKSTALCVLACLLDAQEWASRSCHVGSTWAHNQERMDETSG